MKKIETRTVMRRRSRQRESMAVVVIVSRWANRVVIVSRWANSQGPKQRLAASILLDGYAV